MSVHPMRGGMAPVPIDEPEVVALVRQRGLFLDGIHRGKLTVEFDWTDGRWSLGNVSITFPRSRLLTRNST